MGKTILTFAIILMTTATLFAQSDKTTINIRLFPIQTLEVNPSQKVVNLDYTTQEDYNNGVRLDEPDHLTMYSTGAFVVKVNTTNSSLQSNSGSDIPSSDILITPLEGSINPLASAEFSSALLSTEPQTIISNDTGGINKTFGINYQAKGNQEYVDKYVANERFTAFTTDVIYSIEAR